jgi:hypothetical protein
MIDSSNSDNSVDQNITRLRRRFLKDHNQETNKFFARKQVNILDKISKICLFVSTI